MSEPKTFASLTPTLLARKGAAKPAMRPHQPQVNMFHDTLARAVDQDDLGWNDMGEDAPAPEGQVLAFDPALAVPAAAELPEVVRQQEAIVRDFAEVAPVRAEPDRAEPASVVVAKPAAVTKTARKSAPSRRSALNDGRRAAFTLRVDAERHLKLRLACTVRGRSAQQLVTEALDRLLDELPEISTLASQLARKH